MTRPSLWRFPRQFEVLAQAARFVPQSVIAADGWPLLREDRVTLAQLSALAREFDALSRDDGRDRPAVRFVEWLADERRAPVAYGNRGPGQPAEVDEAA